jgi:hypothetical protein
MAIDWKVFSGLIGVVLGWLLGILTRHFEELWFGAKLKIECDVPGNKDENDTHVYIRFLLQNTNKRRVAKSCRAYLVELHNEREEQNVTALAR